MSDKSDLERELYDLMKEYETPISEPSQISFPSINYGKIIKYALGIGALGALSYLSQDFIIRNIESVTAGGISSLIGGSLMGARLFADNLKRGEDKLKYVVESVALGMASGAFAQYSLFSPYTPIDDPVLDIFRIVIIGGVSLTCGTLLTPVLFFVVETMDSFFSGTSDPERKRNLQDMLDKIDYIGHEVFKFKD